MWHGGWTSSLFGKFHPKFGTVSKQHPMELFFKIADSALEENDIKLSFLKGKQDIVVGGYPSEHEIKIYI